MNGKIVILGDFNGRCGRNISDVLERLELPKKYFYDKDLPDPVEKPNGNAEKLLQLCKDTACLIVNNLHCDKKYFKGSRTFRRRDVWISEIDLAVVSSSVVYSVESLQFDTDLSIPSDHSPVTLSLDISSMVSPVFVSEQLLSHSSELGNR